MAYPNDSRQEIDKPRTEYLDSDAKDLKTESQQMPANQSYLRTNMKQCQILALHRHTY